MVICGVVSLKKIFDFKLSCKNSVVINKAQLLGFACLVASMSIRYSCLSIRTLRFWLCPAIDHEQILIFFDKSSRPIGYVTWAHLAEDSEERLLKHRDFTIHPSEWNEGGRTWIIDFCVPFGGVKEAVRILKNYFQDENIKTVCWARRNEDYMIRKVGCYQLFRRSRIGSAKLC
ncbi:toxin-activating lysine-acyltransferase [Pseudomonas putida]|uniref:RTX toxin-activating lysine-acyltransferase n=1 Tax=Pseudomonas putida TaxID=303 RepID=A0A2Z4RKF2_PSEPU|nr:toxin-activating lysine-acyltransferase [Pseudomonas putida]